MAKKELKSFQEIISEEKRKAKPEDTAQHGRRIGQAERQTAASPKKGKNAGASLLYENKEPSEQQKAAAKPQREPQSAERPAAQPKRNPSSEQRKNPPTQGRKAQQIGEPKNQAEKKPQKRPHQLTSRENISYLPAAMEEPALRKRRSARGAIILLSAILLVGILGFLGYQFVRAEEIDVRGSESFEDSYVISLSGIKSGVHIFNVDKKAAAAAIAQDPHLILQNIEYTFPNKITLVVTERKEAACFEFLGTYVITDSAGVILGHVEGKEQPQNLPIIRGINVTEFALGAKIRTDDTYKQNIMTILLERTEEYQLTGQVKEIDLSDTNSVTLGLANGMKVIFGQADQMQEKLAWLQNILKELEAQGKSGGTIDLSSVEMPTYLPPDEPVSSEPNEPNPE